MKKYSTRYKEFGRFPVLIGENLLNSNDNLAFAVMERWEELGRECRKGAVKVLNFPPGKDTTYLNIIADAYNVSKWAPVGIIKKGKIIDPFDNTETFTITRYTSNRLLVNPKPFFDLDFLKGHRLDSWLERVVNFLA